METSLIIIFSISFALIIVLFIFVFYKIKVQRERINKQIDDLLNNISELSPEEFFVLRNCTNAVNQVSSNFAGVYILHNKTKNMYYVGQGKNVFNRVNSHFTGKGNGDVYADYKYGNRFTIKMIALDRSGFNTLNELERNTIARFDAYNNGYNKTRGNRG